MGPGCLVESWEMTSVEILFSSRTRIDASVRCGSKHIILSLSRCIWVDDFVILIVEMDGC